MTGKPDDRCPHCGCPEVLTFIRQSASGLRSYTSCPGCSSVNGEPPPPKPAPRASKGAA